MKTFVEEAERFVLLDDDKEIGEISWNNHDGYIDVYHTGVDGACQGQGLAGQLLMQIVDKAVREGIKIYPSCSYIKHKEIGHRVVT